MQILKKQLCITLLLTIVGVCTNLQSINAKEDNKPNLMTRIVDSYNQTQDRLRESAKPFKKRKHDETTNDTGPIQATKEAVLPEGWKPGTDNSKGPITIPSDTGPIQVTKEAVLPLQEAPGTDNDIAPTLMSIEIQPAELGDLLKKNDRKPFEIIDAIWSSGIGKPSTLAATDIQKLQSLADRGIFVLPENMSGFFTQNKQKYTDKMARSKYLYIKFKMEEGSYHITIPDHTKDFKPYNLPENKRSDIFYISDQKAVENILNNPTVNADRVKSGDPLNKIEPKAPIENLIADEAKEELTNPDGIIEEGKVVVKESLPKSAIIKLKDLLKILPANDQQAFTIIDAWYGIQGGSKNITTLAKKKLQALADKGLFIIPKNMNKFFGGNPVKKAKKTLYVKFRMQDKIYEISIPQHKKDRKIKKLPKKVGGYRWFITKAKDNLKNILDQSRLKTLASKKRLKNNFDILKKMGKDKALANSTHALEVFFAETEHLFKTYNKASKKEKNNLIKIIKRARTVFSEQNPPAMATMIALAEKHGFPNNLANALDFLRENTQWTGKASAIQFSQAVKNIASLNESEKLSSEETKDLMSIVQAAQMVNEAPEYKSTRDNLEKIFDNLKIPADEAPEELPDPNLIDSKLVIEKASEITYEAQLQKLIAMRALQNSQDKDACIDQIQELVRNRAYASKDQMNIVGGIISYYINISPYFKNDAKRLKKLRKTETDLNSGITYNSRLEASKSCMDRETLLPEEQDEWFNILGSLAREKGKANIHEEAIARAHLIFAQREYKDEESAKELNDIEAIFNTPAKEVKSPEEQVNQAEKPIEKSQTDEEKEKEENAQESSTAIVNDAAESAVKGEPVKIKKNAPYGAQVMGGFAQVLATQMNPSKKGTAGCLVLLKRLVNNKFLGSENDIQLLKSLLQYAIGNITDKKFTNEVKLLGKTLGASLDFPQQLKSFRDVIIRSDFVQQENLQKDALKYIERLMKNMPKKANNSLKVDVKSILLAAASIFPNEANKKRLIQLQESVKIKNVKSIPLIKKATKKVSQQSIISRIDRLGEIKATDKVMKQLEELIEDRPRASSGSLEFLADYITSYMENVSFKKHVSRLKEFLAILNRPATTAEEISELEELSTLKKLKPSQTMEVLRILQNLQKKLNDVDADTITRIKGTLLVLSPKVLPSHKASFDSLKAIFDAPIEVVAPKAITDTGEKLPDALTEEKKEKNEAKEKQVEASSTTTPAVTIIMQKAIGKEVTTKATDIAKLKIEQSGLDKSGPQHLAKQSEIEALEKEVGNLQEELKTTGRPTRQASRRSRGSSTGRTSSARGRAVRVGSVRGARSSSPRSGSRRSTRFGTNRESRISTGGRSVTISRSQTAPATEGRTARRSTRVPRSSSTRNSTPRRGVTRTQLSSETDETAIRSEPALSTSGRTGTATARRSTRIPRSSSTRNSAPRRGVARNRDSSGTDEEVRALEPVASSRTVTARSSSSPESSARRTGAEATGTRVVSSGINNITQPEIEEKVEEIKNSSRSRNLDRIKEQMRATTEPIVFG